MGKTAYRLDLQGRFSGVHPVFHVSLLRRHTPGGASAEPPAPIEVDGTDEFEVEALLKHRGQGRRRQYLVHWAGYGVANDEWVDERDLEHAGRLLQEYKRQHGLD